MSAKLTVKPKPKAKPDKEQSARFIETARLLEADESGEKFEQAVKLVVAKTAPQKDDSGY